MQNMTKGSGSSRRRFDALDLVERGFLAIILLLAFLLAWSLGWAVGEGLRNAGWL